MATGRTVGSKYTRIYMDGYDMSGYIRSVGHLSWGFRANDIVTLADSITGALPGQCDISVGTINAVLDNTTSGFHNTFEDASDAVRDVMVPLGIRAAPAAGDPAFCAQVAQNSYKSNLSDGVLTVSVDLGSWDNRADTIAYPIPWGYLIHAPNGEIIANTSGSANHSVTAATAAGGYMMYQVFGGNTGTVTVKLQDSTGGAWSDLLTSGELTQDTPQSGIVALGLTDTVNEDLRWQLAFGTATECNFALAFVRGY